MKSKRVASIPQPSQAERVALNARSRAKVIGLANAGGDTTNAIKQAAEFGITKGGQTLAGLLVFVSDVAALGLPAAQGLVVTETWYWDMNDRNRARTKRWQAERPGKFPTMIHAGVYSSTSQSNRGAEIRWRWQSGRRENEGDADRRPSFWQGNRAYRWT
jgi:ABC-type branched-subunit amino acid transport system substrate-binding protein